MAVSPCGQRNYDMDEASLQTLAANNPVASMLAFHQMIENVREHLLCLSGERAWNQPMPSAFIDDMPEDAREEPREKGIYGVCTSNRDVKETNKRAASLTRIGLSAAASAAETIAVAAALPVMHSTATAVGTASLEHSSACTMTSSALFHCSALFVAAAALHAISAGGGLTTD